ncbi:MAG: D-alanyl-D-alanine carboxypeptidase/D-alanyl-D-alanine-endopeptidase [Deinococcota bacterium]
MSLGYGQMVDVAALEALIDAGPIPLEGRGEYEGAHIGLVVIDAETGDVLVDIRGGEGFTPASSMKILPTSAILDALGPNFQFETVVLASEPDEGTIERLTLRGEGDPSLAQFGSDNSLAALAQQLADQGITEIDDLHVDDYAFDWPRWGSGWMWDDPAYPYGAVFVEGDAAPYVDMTIGAVADAELITNPDAYPREVGKLFALELARVGITVDGDIMRGTAEDADAVIASVQSRPLHELVTDANKRSLNHYAEQLYARLGLAGEPSTRGRSFDALTEFLLKADVDSDQMRIRDASGLSRYNLVTPMQLSKVLSYMYQNPITTDGAEVSPRDAFDASSNVLVNSLPVAAADGDVGGTLRNRLVDEGITVIAKTGSMTGVSSLSGYLVTESGQVLAFSMLMDNFVGFTSDMRRLQDALMREMVTF